MPRLSASGSFAGVYGISSAVAAGGDETANYVGAVMVFQQTAAPTGWTKITTDDDAILTATTGSLTTGGISGFSSAFTNVSLSGTASGASVSLSPTTLTTEQLAPHRHDYVPASIQNPRPGSSLPAGYAPDADPWPFMGPGAISNPYTGPTGHTHPNPPGPFSSPAPVVFFTKDLRVKYVDVIIASKD